jgi:hypothetical protein
MNEEEENIDLNSMLYWWPKTKELSTLIPMPRTEICMLPKKSRTELIRMIDGAGTGLDMGDIKITASRIGYPLFMRTDQASAKFDWKDTCYVEKESDLLSHIVKMIDWHMMADIMGLPFKALVFREYIPMDAPFTAFYGGMPVNRERRYFAESGRVMCHHPYWPMNAIEEPSVRDWRSKLRLLNEETPDEVETLSNYATMLSAKLGGSWSVDFCHSKTGVWYFIDAALASDSWHAAGCPNKLTKNEEGS